MTIIVFYNDPLSPNLLAARVSMFTRIAAPRDSSCICFMRAGIECRALNSVNLLPSMTRTVETRCPVGRKGRTSRYFTFFAEFYDVAVRCKNQYREFVCTWQRGIGAKGFAKGDFEDGKRAETCFSRI